MITSYAKLLLAENEHAVPTWVENSFPIIKIVLACLILVCAIFMIVAVLSQKNEENGVSAITGSADTFYNRNKGTSIQGKIKKLTVIDAILLVVFCLAFLILNFIYVGTI